MTAEPLNGQGEPTAANVSPALGHEPPHLILSMVEVFEPKVTEKGRYGLVRCPYFVYFVYFVAEELDGLGLVGSQVSRKRHGQSKPFLGRRRSPDQSLHLTPFSATNHAEEL
jgi:hypothetical protein